MKARMLFNFCLTPIEKIQPWGNDNDFSLSWFGLTDGCYWLQTEEIELFRYSQKVLEGTSRPDNDYGCGPYIEYQVVRLWEDVLEILPDVLSPVPQAVTEKLAASNFRAWRAAVEHWMLTKPKGLDELSYEDATEWIRKRHLLSLHLVAGPRIWLWNDGRYIHFEWDNRDLQIDGVPVWDAQLGSWQLTVEEFLEEVRAFNRAFIQAMQLRVEQIAANWPRPDVHIDIDKLVLEQVDRSTWLAKSLDQPRQEHSLDWGTILKAIDFIDTEIKP